MYNYKPLPSWKRKEQEDNRMVWAAIGLGWVLLCRRQDLEQMVSGYLEAAVWTDAPDDGTEWGQLSQDALEKAKKDCQSFALKAHLAGIPLESLKDAAYAQIGHDLWLTRNGHGAGFWDRPKMYNGQMMADHLSALCKEMGGSALIQGDDGFLYFEEA